LKHPAGKEYRELLTGNIVHLADTDATTLQQGQKLRLKYLCTVEIASTEPLVGKVLDVATQPAPPGMQVIQWVPSSGIKVTVKRPDGVDEGLGELLIATELDNVVQFERYGFVRIDSVNEEEMAVVAYLTH
jgi:glutamyl-tRNA synthetase